MCSQEHRQQRFQKVILDQTAQSQCLHSSIYFLSPLILHSGSVGSWSLSQLSLGVKRWSRGRGSGGLHPGQLEGSPHRQTTVSSVVFTLPVASWRCNKELPTRSRGAGPLHQSWPSGGVSGQVWSSNRRGAFRGRVECGGQTFASFGTLTLNHVTNYVHLYTLVSWVLQISFFFFFEQAV